MRLAMKLSMGELTKEDDKMEKEKIDKVEKLKSEKRKRSDSDLLIANRGDDGKIFSIILCPLFYKSYQLFSFH